MATQQNIQKIVGVAEGGVAAVAGSGWFTYQWWTDTISFPANHADDSWWV